MACDRKCAVPSCAAPARGGAGLLSHLFAMCGAPDVGKDVVVVEPDTEARAMNWMEGKRLTWEHSGEEFAVAGRSRVTAVKANVPVPVLERRLYLLALTSDLRSIPWEESAHFFSLDTEVRYSAFCADFGPYNLGMTHHFFTVLKSLLLAPALAHKRIVYCTAAKDTDTTNAMYLLSAFLITHLGASPEDAVLPFSSIQKGKGLVGFRDATWVQSTFDLSLLDTSAALSAAMRLHLYDPRTFNAPEYFYYDEPANGDLHEVVQGKFIAFKGPSERRDQQRAAAAAAAGLEAVIKHPSDYVDVFRVKRVTTIVRLNSKEYCKSAFTEAGFVHVDLYYPDCTAPPDSVVDEFLRLAEHGDTGVIAVHCFAGLGRTGTLFALCCLPCGVCPVVFAMWCLPCG
jgi:cell division cycle 14